MRTHLVPLALPCIAACIDHDPVPLVDHDAWHLVSQGDDPWDDRPTESGCAPSGWFSEPLGEDEASLQVDTGLCHYLTVSQPVLAPIKEADSIHLRLWHYELTGDGGPELQEAHAAVRVGAAVDWEERVPIPSGTGSLLSPRFLAIEAAEEGTTIYFHLHNHGSNTWNLIEVSDARCGGELCPPP